MLSLAVMEVSETAGMTRATHSFRFTPTYFAWGAERREKRETYKHGSLLAMEGGGTVVLSNEYGVISSTRWKRPAWRIPSRWGVDWKVAHPPSRRVVGRHIFLCDKRNGGGAELCVVRAMHATCDDRRTNNSLAYVVVCSSGQVSR